MAGFKRNSRFSRWKHIYADAKTDAADRCHNLGKENHENTNHISKQWPNKTATICNPTSTKTENENNDHTRQVNLFNCRPDRYLMSRLRAVESPICGWKWRALRTPNGVGIQRVKRRFGISDSGDASEHCDMPRGCCAFSSQRE